MSVCVSGGGAGFSVKSVVIESLREGHGLLGRAPQ